MRAFEQVERCLKEKAPHQRQRSFYQLVEYVGKDDSMVKQLEIDLKEYADLRNAIIHERGGGYAIAEPNSRAVDDIEQIAKLVRTPPTVLPLFQSEVVELDYDERITVALQLILERSISQVPIRRGREMIGLLTTDTIARWLGTCVEGHAVNLGDTPLATVLDYTENKESHAFFTKTATVFDVIDLFQSREHLGKRLDAILITNQGRDTEEILGIVTISDLPKAFHAVARSYSTLRT